MLFKDDASRILWDAQGSFCKHRFQDYFNYYNLNSMDHTNTILVVAVKEGTYFRIEYSLYVRLRKYL